MAGTVLAQKTVNLSATINFTDNGTTGLSRWDGVANGSVMPLGAATMRGTITQGVDVNTSLQPSGIAGVTYQFWFNRLDGFTMTGQFQPSSTAIQVLCTITSGAGKYAGATGTAMLDIGPPYAKISSGTGNITVSGTTTSLTFGSFLGDGDALLSITENYTGTGTATGMGNVSSAFQYGYNESTINSSIVPENYEATGTLSFNASDAINFYFELFGQPAPNTPVTITGGTGAYAGASGTLTLNVTGGSMSALTASLTGNITIPAAGTPIITSVKTVFQTLFANNVPTGLSANAWLQINGTNLVPAGTPASGAIWSTAPSFAMGELPVSLGPITVNINGPNAYIYFYCSAATDPACPQDQINVLTQPGAVALAPALADRANNIDPQKYAQLTVTNGTGNTSAPFLVPAQVVTPSFLLFDTAGHVIATHSDNSLLGPSSLYPGSSTPAMPGEPIVIYGVGFGLPTGNVTAGSATQSGTLPHIPECWIGTTQTPVTAAVLVSPGLYAFGMNVPQNAPSGDNLIACLYNANSNSSPGSAGVTMQAGNLIAVQ